MGLGGRGDLLLSLLFFSGFGAVFWFFGRGVLLVSIFLLVSMLLILQFLGMVGWLVALGGVAWTIVAGLVLLSVVTFYIYFLHIYL